DEWSTRTDGAGRRSGAIPLPRQAPWPRLTPLPLLNAANALPVPAQSVFELRDRPRPAARMTPLPTRHAEATVSTDHARDGAKQGPAAARASRRAIAGKTQV